MSSARYELADEPRVWNKEDIAGQARRGVRRLTIRHLEVDRQEGRRKSEADTAEDRKYVVAGKGTAERVGRVWLVLVSATAESLQKPDLDRRHVASAGGEAFLVRTPLHRLAPEPVGGMVAAAAVVGD